MCLHILPRLQKMNLDILERVFHFLIENNFLFASIYKARNFGYFETPAQNSERVKCIFYS